MAGSRYQGPQEGAGLPQQLLHLMSPCLLRARESQRHLLQLRDMQDPPLWLPSVQMDTLRLQVGWEGGHRYLRLSPVVFPAPHATPPGALTPSAAPDDPRRECAPHTHTHTDTHTYTHTTRLS